MVNYNPSAEQPIQMYNPLAAAPMCVYSLLQLHEHTGPRVLSQAATCKPTVNYY